MDPLATSSRWNESFSYVSLGLFNLTRWALNCPPPRPKPIFYFSAPSTSTEPEVSIFSALSIDIFAVFFTCLAAYTLQWIINYFVRFCASIGYVLSGADNRDSISAPPTPPEIVPVPVSKQNFINIPHTPVKMNEPVDCSVSHSAILATRPDVSHQSDHNASASSSMQDGRSRAGSENLFRERVELPGQENVTSVYGGPDKLSGKFTVEDDGLTEFVWLGDDSKEALSLTGSFLGFAMSFPLSLENGKLRLKMQLPPGDHEYQFITADNA